MSTQPWNMLEAEQAICDRLEWATMQEQNGIAAWCRRVLTRQSLSALAEDKQVVPALYVIYQGESALDVTEHQTLEAHRFLVALVVANAAAQRTAIQVNAEAGLYIPRVKSALKGFAPPGCIAPLKQVTPPPPYYTSGHAYYPMMFEAYVAFSDLYGVAQARPSRINSSITPTVINR